MPIADKKEYRDSMLKCPFCLAEMESMQTMQAPFGNDIDGATCDCGAVCAYDRTGKNLGETFNDALAWAFDWDYDAAFDCEEGAYEECMVLYNDKIRNHYCLDIDTSPLDRSPRYIFVKRTQDK